MLRVPSTATHTLSVRTHPSQLPIQRWDVSTEEDVWRNTHLAEAIAMVLKSYLSILVRSLHGIEESNGIEESTGAVVRMCMEGMRE